MAESRSPAKKQARAVAADDGHSARWNSFVNSKLQNLTNANPGGLPGIGKVYAAEWAKKGYPTALSVFALFLRSGAKQFADIAEKDIKMRPSSVQDLLSSIESRWRFLLACLFACSLINELFSQQKKVR
jgi:hypothetical protein